MVENCGWLLCSLGDIKYSIKKSFKFKKKIIILSEVSIVRLSTLLFDNLTNLLIDFTETFSLYKSALFLIIVIILLHCEIVLDLDLEWF